MRVSTVTSIVAGAAWLVWWIWFNSASYLDLLGGALTAWLAYSLTRSHYEKALAEANQHLAVANDNAHWWCWVATNRPPPTFDGFCQWVFEGFPTTEFANHPVAEYLRTLTGCEPKWDDINLRWVWMGGDGKNYRWKQEPWMEEYAPARTREACEIRLRRAGITRETMPPLTPAATLASSDRELPVAPLVK